MLRTTLGVAAAVVLAVPTLLSTPIPVSQKPAVGAAAPEIDGQVWFNHIGKAPNLASLRGRAILLEFWATW